MRYKEKNIVFRVDAANHIGTGHLQRCITLAKELQKTGYQIIFVMIPFDLSFINLVKKESINVITMSAPLLESIKTDDSATWLGRTQEDDAKDFLAVTRHIDFSWCIVDHYSIDYKWQKLVRKNISKIFVIDDLANRKHECDILLDQNYWSNFLTRYDPLINNNCLRLLGPKYSLLRDEFKTLRATENREKTELSNILINFGGIGNYVLLEKVATVLPQFSHKYNFTIITGKMTTSSFDVIKNKLASTGVNVTETTSNMAKLMFESDYAFGACGSTVWERFCLGVNSALVEVADNQHELLGFLAHKSLVDYLGKASELSYEQIQSFIETLNLDSIIYSERKTRIMSLVDGEGATRVASKIKELQYV